jgi:hypothetical protein
MKKVLVLSALLLCGCAQSQKLTDGYGNVGYELACIARSDTRCEREAKKLCPNGYMVLYEQPDHGILGVTHERTIYCKHPDPKAALPMPSAPPPPSEPTLVQPPSEAAKPVPGKPAEPTLGAPITAPPKSAKPAIPVNQ